MKAWDWESSAQVQSGRVGTMQLATTRIGKRWTLGSFNSSKSENAVWMGVSAPSLLARTNEGARELFFRPVAAGSFPAYTRGLPACGKSQRCAHPECGHHPNTLRSPKCVHHPNACIYRGRAALQCVRENSFSGNPVERRTAKSSPGGSNQLSPALQRWVE
jgi:hypothetical protein